MKIVMDEKIPYLRDVLTEMGHRVVALPGSGIKCDDIIDAEALFVRTRTRCNAALLDGSGVRFIGTATIGYDHIDADFCSKKGIRWTSAPGCNADAVLQYVQSSIYSWARDYNVELRGLAIGIVGVGQIGGRVARWAHNVGMRVLLNDPPREACGEEGFSSLGEIASSCDIITFHPTLSREGLFPSYHLADEAFFSSLSHCRLLLNVSRGPVVDNKALYEALECGKLPCAVLDVWEDEPEIDLSLLGKLYIATPHIAGYSAEGKMNASRMMVEAFAQFSNHTGALPQMSLPSPVPAHVFAADEAAALLDIYSPLEDTARLKAAPSLFEDLRNNYKLRREPSSYDIILKTAL